MQWMVVEWILNRLQMKVISVAFKKNGSRCILRIFYALGAFPLFKAIAGAAVGSCLKTGRHFIFVMIY